MEELRKETYSSRREAAQAAAAAKATVYISGRRLVATATVDGELRVYNLGGPENACRWRWMPEVKAEDIA